MFGPATIFTGQLPGLDANFINPSDKKVTSTEEVVNNNMLIDQLNFNNAKTISTQEYSNDLKITKEGLIKDIKNNTAYEYDESREIDLDKLEGQLSSWKTDWRGNFIPNTFT